MVEIIIGGSICGGDAPVAAGVSIGYFNTLAELRAETSVFTIPVSVFVAGDQAANDGFGGIFTYDPDSTAPDNGYSIIAQTENTGAGRWIINPEAAPAPGSPVPRNIADLQSDIVNVFSWGAIGDGSSRALSSVSAFGGQSSFGWTLAQWKAVLPAAAALTDELDWAAWQSALNFAATADAPVVAMRGTFVINKPLNRPAGVSVLMSAFTTIRADAVINSIMTSPAATLETGATIQGGSLDCNFQASIGLEINCAASVSVIDVAVLNSTGSAFKIGDPSAVSPSIENHFVRCRSTWSTIPAGQNPTAASVGLLLSGCNASYFTDCVLVNHATGVSLSNNSIGNHFKGVRVYNVAAVSQMLVGYVTDSASTQTHYTDCVASQCQTYGWNLFAPHQFLVNCQVDLSAGLPNNLIGVMDRVGSQAITNLAVFGTIGVPVQQDIAFASDAVKSLTSVSQVTDLNVNVVYSNSNGGIPTGTIQYFALSTPPSGWLAIDGSAVSRVINAALFAQIGTTYGPGDGVTTFNLPNGEGYFIRGWNPNGTGPDAGRVFGSTQAEMIGPHAHNVTPKQNFAGLTTTASTGGVGSPLMNNGTTPAAALTTDNGAGTETRPRNIAFLICIKT